MQVQVLPIAAVTLLLWWVTGSLFMEDMMAINTLMTSGSWTSKLGAGTRCRSR
jgi:hypothetical protein